jgi:hypothetical protein
MCALKRGAVAQLGERRVRNAEVVGSTPICSTNISKNQRRTDGRVRPGTSRSASALPFVSVA